MREFYRGDEIPGESKDDDELEAHRSRVERVDEAQVGHHVYAEADWRDPLRIGEAEEERQAQEG